MKTRKILSLSVTIAALVLSTFLYLGLRDANQKLTTQSSTNVRLENEVQQLKQKLSRFDGIEKTDLLNVCINRASNVYSSYIKENSVSTTVGSVTTLTPKSSDTIRIATEAMDATKKGCTDTFGS